MNYGVNRVLGVALTFGAYFAYEQYDAYVNYAPAQARVTRVADVCYMEKDSGGKVTKSGEFTCDIVESAVKNHPQWLGARITYDINLDFDYVSPADGLMHSGTRALTAWPGGKRLSRGDTFMMRASKTDPEDTRAI